MLRSKTSSVILLLLSIATMAFGSTYSEQYIWNSVFDRSAGAAVLYAITGYVPGPHGNTSYSTNWILNQIYDPANKALRSGVVGGSDTTLRGRLVGDVAPLSGEVLGWDGSAWVPMTGVPADSSAYAFTAGMSDTASFSWKADTANNSFWSFRVGKNPMADPYQDNVWYTYMEALPDTGASPDTTLLIRSVMRSGGSSSIVDVGWFDRSGYHGSTKGNRADVDTLTSIIAYLVSPDFADTAFIKTTGDSTIFDSKNPIRIGHNTIILGTDGLVQISNLNIDSVSINNGILLSTVDAGSGQSAFSFKAIRDWQAGLNSVFSIEDSNGILFGVYGNGHAAAKSFDINSSKLTVSYSDSGFFSESISPVAPKHFKFIFDSAGTVTTPVEISERGMNVDSLAFLIGTIESYGYIWGADAGGNLKSWIQLDYNGYASLGVVDGFDYMTENATWVFEWDTLNNTYYNLRGGNKISLTQFNNATAFGWRSTTVFPTPAPYYSVKIKSPYDTTELRVNRDSVIVGGDGDFYAYNNSSLNTLYLVSTDGGDIQSTDSLLFVTNFSPNEVRKGRAAGLGISSYSRQSPVEYTIDTVAISGVTTSSQIQMTWQGPTIPSKPLTFMAGTDTVFVHIDVSDTAKAAAEGYVIWQK